MSEFHKILKNDSSSDSEEGELSEDNQELDTNQETNDNKLLDPKTLKTSKSLQIVDKMDTKRNNRFSIWSDLLIEEELNHSVSNSMDIKKRQSKTRKLDRNCENYSFWMKKQLETNSEQQLIQKTTHSDVHKKKTKKKKKSHKDKQMSKSGDIVLEIAKKLREPKVDLLRRVCQTIGEQKTTELFSATLDIESAGGLMTIDGKRRRTPGGVFFQLLKNDGNITKETIDLIFSSEQKNLKHKKLNKKSKHNIKHKNLNNKLLSEMKIICQTNEGTSNATETQSLSSMEP